MIPLSSHSFSNTTHKHKYARRKAGRLQLRCARRKARRLKLGAPGEKPGVFSYGAGAGAGAAGFTVERLSIS